MAFHMCDDGWCLMCGSNVRVVDGIWDVVRGAEVSSEAAHVYLGELEQVSNGMYGNLYPSLQSFVAVYAWPIVNCFNILLTSAHIHWSSSLYIDAVPPLLITIISTKQLSSCGCPLCTVPLWILSTWGLNFYVPGYSWTVDSPHEVLSTYASNYVELLFDAYPIQVCVSLAFCRGGLLWPDKESTAYIYSPQLTIALNSPLD